MKKPVFKINSTSLLQTFDQLQKIPGGNLIFSQILGRVVPYSGSIPFRVVSLKPGNCAVALADKKSIRNHLGSVHAMALANLGEIASGLAALSFISAAERGILVQFQINYVKKARGSLFAHGFIEETKYTENVLHSRFEILNANSEKVAEGHAGWFISLA